MHPISRLHRLLSLLRSMLTPERRNRLLARYRSDQAEHPAIATLSGSVGELKELLALIGDDLPRPIVLDYDPLIPEADRLLDAVLPSPADLEALAAEPNLDEDLPPLNMVDGRKPCPKCPEKMDLETNGYWSCPTCDYRESAADTESD